jgi:Zn-dependent protease/predicted transcriptional regulator
MNGNIKITRIWGIPVYINYSWFLIFFLITWSLATGYFPKEYPLLSFTVYLILGAITSLLFFASVLAHELGHSILALRDRIPVKSITLFIFGGVAQITREPPSPGSEFRIAIAGPLTSFALAGLFGGLYLLDQSIPFLAAPSNYLMRINFILALFNLIPGFPLDGGRVFRALVWKWTGSLQKATRIASTSGQIVAFGFIGFGIFTIFTGQFFNGLWLIFIGWFLQNAASSNYLALNFQQALAGLKVSQVMSRDLTTVDFLTPVSQIVEEKVIGQNQQTFFVEQFGEIVGTVSVQDILRLNRSKWRFTTVQQIMRPIKTTANVEAEMDLMTALQQMENAKLNQISVFESGNPVGILTRDQVIKYARMRAELGS